MTHENNRSKKKKTVKEGINNAANTKEGTDGQT